MKSYGIGFLIDLLKISSKQMAQYVNVDRTLVSKWKTGVRKLDVNALYFDKVLEFLIHKNNELGINSLESLFSSIYLDNSDKINSKAQLKKYIKRFILNNDTSENFYKKVSNLDGYSYIASVPIYHGLESKKKAMMNLLEVASREETPTKITFIFVGVFDFLIDKSEFLNNWVKKVKELLDKGFKVELIYSSYSISDFFIYLCPIAVHKNCKVLSHTNCISNRCNLLLHILHNKMVLYGFSENATSLSNTFAYIFTDPVSLLKYSIMAENIVKDSEETFFTYNSKLISKQGNKIRGFANNENNIKKNNTIFYYNKTILPSLMSDDLYLDVLSNSLTCQEQINEEFLRFKTIKDKFFKTFENNKVIRFYSIKDLLNISSQDYNSYEKNEVFSYPNLVLSKKQFKQYMDQLSDLLLNEPNVHICLYLDDFEALVSSIFFWCQKNEHMFIFDNNSYKLRYCKDISFIASISNLFEKKYLNTFEEFKDKHSVAKFLKDL